MRDVLAEFARSYRDYARCRRVDWRITAIMVHCLDFGCSIDYRWDSVAAVNHFLRRRLGYESSYLEKSEMFMWYFTQIIWNQQSIKQTIVCRSVETFLYFFTI